MAVFGNDGHRHSRLKLLLFQLREVAETRVIHSCFFENHWLEVHTNPAGNTLPQSHFNFTHEFLILLVCACKRQPLFVFVIEVKECSVAGNGTDDCIYKVSQYLIKLDSRTDCRNNLFHQVILLITTITFSYLSNIFLVMIPLLLVF